MPRNGKKAGAIEKRLDEVCVLRTECADACDAKVGDQSDASLDSLATFRNKVGIRDGLVATAKISESNVYVVVWRCSEAFAVIAEQHDLVGQKSNSTNFLGQFRIGEVRGDPPDPGLPLR